MTIEDEAIVAAIRALFSQLSEQQQDDAVTLLDLDTEHDALGDEKTRVAARAAEILRGW